MTDEHDSERRIRNLEERVEQLEQAQARERQKFRADAAAFFSRIVTVIQSFLVKLGAFQELLQRFEIRLTRLERPAAHSDTGQLSQKRLLVRLIDHHFNADELKNLMFDIGINYEDIQNGGQDGRVRALVQYCERHNMLGRLVERCQELRPRVHGWPPFFDEADWL